MKTKNSNKFVYLALFLFLSFFMSWWGGYITSYFKEPWMFAPVWISLYLIMGYAAWLMWSSKEKTQKVLNVYFIHLVINASWSVSFFAFHQILVSLIIIGLIIIFVIWLIKLYYPINKISAYLMVPYLFWLCFAFILNYSIFTLN